MILIFLAPQLEHPSSSCPAGRGWTNRKNMAKSGRKFSSRRGEDVERAISSEIALSRGRANADAFLPSSWDKQKHGGAENNWIQLKNFPVFGLQKRKLIIFLTFFSSLMSHKTLPASHPRKDDKVTFAITLRDVKCQKTFHSDEADEGATAREAEEEDSVVRRKLKTKLRWNSNYSFLIFPSANPSCCEREKLETNVRCRLHGRRAQMSLSDCGRRSDESR